jgi:hypothetical protein
MKRVALAIVFAAVLIPAVFGQDWRQDLAASSSGSPANATSADIQRLMRSAQLASPYYMGLRPGDYEANRAMIRRAALYLATVDLVNRDPGVRQALGGAFSSLAALAWLPGYVPQYGTGAAAPQPGQPVAIPAPEEPRFIKQPVEINNVSAAERPQADEAAQQYQLATTKGASAWRSAAALRRSLQSRGYQLNSDTEVSLARMQVYFDLAADALKARDWAGAATHIERARYETEKVAKVAGR